MLLGVGVGGLVVGGGGSAVACVEVGRLAAEVVLERVDLADGTDVVVVREGNNLVQKG